MISTVAFHCQAHQYMVLIEGSIDTMHACTYVCMHVVIMHRSADTV